MFFILEAVEKQRGIVSLADDWVLIFIVFQEELRIVS
jgi:hypothetical protein